MLTCDKEERRGPALLLAMVLCFALTLGLGAAAPMLGAPFPGGTAARGVSHGTAAASDLSPDLSARISPVAGHSAASAALRDVNAGLLSAWTAPGADPILTAPDGSQLPAGPGFLARILQVGGISGFVINTTNNPMPNVTVELRDGAQNLL